MVEKVLRIWNYVEMSINGEVISTSGLTEAYLETILEVLKGPIGVAIVERMTRIWNHIEMSINCEVITTSGLTEVILETILDVLNAPNKQTPFWYSEACVLDRP